MPFLIALALLQDAPLGWLAGLWCTAPQGPEGKNTCERWQAGPGGEMRGTSESSIEAGPHERLNLLLEVMEIRRVGAGFVFHAAPQGQAPADFASIAVGARSITFEDRAHDYPQRIRYAREGATLVAEISLADGGKPQRWEYRRVGD